MEEVFSVIPSFPDYEVSNCGRVRTLARKLRYVHSVTGKELFRESTTRFLKMHFNNRTGYNFYQLYRDKKMYNKPVHQLVAEAFLIKMPGQDTVNHKDGNKLNNRVDNLEWCTDSYNHEHATKNGLLARGTSVSSSKLNELCVLAIRRMLNEGVSHSKIAKWFCVSRPAISLIKSGHTWKHALTGEDLNVEL